MSEPTVPGSEIRPQGLGRECGRCGAPVAGTSSFYDPDGPENPLCCWPCLKRYALRQGGEG